MVILDDRQQKAQRLAYGGKVTPLAAGFWKVQSESRPDVTYLVDVLDNQCTCPDWQHRRPAGGCKHMRAVAVERRRQEARRRIERIADEIWGPALNG